MNKSNDKQTYFESQRDMLLGKISANMESVLANLNTLNRSLEGVNAVGKEFESVSQLWSNFYTSLDRNEEPELQETNDQESRNEE